MKSVTEILGGSQQLLDISYNIQNVFEVYLTENHKVFLNMLRVIEDSLPIIADNYAGTGRKSYPLLPFIRAFIAKSFFKLVTNRDLIILLKSDLNLKQICGFRQIPSEASFSRRFDIISKSHMMEQAINNTACKYYESQIVGHISRDSTSISAREKAINCKKEVKDAVEPKRKRGRPRKGEVVEPKEDSRLTKQISQKPGDALRELNTKCAWGGKKNSKGKTLFWSGYKLHLDVTDIGFPVTAVVT